MEKWVGIFFFAGLLLLACMTFMVDDEGRLFAARGKPYFANFKNAAGLAPGDPVWVAGIKKGAVRSVEFADNAARAEFTLDANVRLHDDAWASVRSAGLIGGNRRLDIEPGTPGKPPLAGQEVKARFAGTEMEDLMSRASAAMTEIENAFKENSPNIKATFENMRSVTEKLDKGEGTLGKLLTDKEVFDNLKKTMEKVGAASDDLQAAMKGVRSFGEALDKGEGSLGKLAKSSEMHDKAMSALTDVGEAAKNLKKFSEDLSEGKGTLGKLATDDALYRKMERAVDDLSSAANKVSDSKGSLGKFINDPAVYDNVQKAAENLAEFSERLKRNDGTLGKLLTDDSLYTEAKGFFKESRRAVEDAREQAPISAFASMFFSAVR